jgi:hypothetical protein
MVTDPSQATPRFGVVTARGAPLPPKGAGGSAARAELARRFSLALDSMGLSGTLVLCCYERLAGIPSEDQRHTCHRRAWKDWRTVQRGDRVPEFSLPIHLLGTKTSGGRERRRRSYRV